MAWMGGVEEKRMEEGEGGIKVFGGGVGREV